VPLTDMRKLWLHPSSGSDAWRIVAGLLVGLVLLTCFGIMRHLGVRARWSFAQTSHAAQARRS
jgi:hypothetical protein